MIAAMASPVATFAEHCARRELAYTVDAAGAPVWPPRNVALIDLDEGYRMMASVDADEVVIGMRVTVRFGDDGTPVFA